MSIVISCLVHTVKVTGDVNITEGTVGILAGSVSLSLSFFLSVSLPNNVCTYACTDGATSAQQMQVTSTPQRSPSPPSNDELPKETLGKKCQCAAAHFA